MFIRWLAPKKVCIKTGFFYTYLRIMYNISIKLYVYVYNINQK